MNLWARFNALNETSPILVGTLVGVEVWNQSIIEWPNGGRQAVYGGGTIGQRYFVTRTSNGAEWRLDGEAPNLPLLTLEV